MTEEQQEQSRPMALDCLDAAAHVLNQIAALSKSELTNRMNPDAAAQAVRAANVAIAYSLNGLLAVAIEVSSTALPLLRAKAEANRIEQFLNDEGVPE